MIESVGLDVEGLKPGDRVAYAGPIGGYAEVRLIEADRLVKLPDAINDEQAAAMMLQGMTVDMLLRSVWPLHAGDTILIHAAAGGVGLIMCQWAAALGATVIGAVSSDEKAELARANGCHHAIVYSKQDFVAEVDRLTEGNKLPVVYDSVGRDTFVRSLDCLQTARVDGQLRPGVGTGRAVRARPAGAKRLALSDPPNPVRLYRHAGTAGAVGCEPVRRGPNRQGQDRYRAALPLCRTPPKRTARLNPATLSDRRS